MATIQDLRALALTYPDVEETDKVPSFRLLAFKTGGKGFIGVEKDELHATFALSEVEVQTACTDIPSAEIITKGNRQVGVRVILDQLSTAQLQDIVKRSWSCVATTL